MSSTPSPSGHFTVIIPTRCRPDTLEKCLGTVTSQDCDALSILVSDNASGDHTEDVVRSARDPRIGYVNPGQRLSMSLNYEFALSKVERADTWVTIIGDDDGLLPGALRRAGELVKGSGLLALRSAVCTYTWPSLRGSSFGRLGVPLGSRVERRNSARAIARVMECRAPYPALPMLYNGGFVHMSVLASIRERLGRFYHSLNPDVFSAFAIASVLHDYLHTEEPLAINGLSAHSTGIAYSGELGSGSKAAQMFRREGNLPLHPDIPLCASGDVPLGQPLVYEAFLQTASLRDPLREPPHRRQLELALATAPATRLAQTEAWGRLFAAQHGLDFEEVRVHARAERRWRRIAGGLETVKAAVSIYALGSPELPLRDVYEASIAAGAVRRTVGGPLGNLPRLARRALDRARAWVS